jgi:hypothetical protein
MIARRLILLLQLLIRKGSEAVLGHVRSVDRAGVEKRVRIAKQEVLGKRDCRRIVGSSELKR